MNPKICLTKQQQVDHWQQLYLQAKLDGKTDLMKKYGAILLKLGAKIPK